MQGSGQSRENTMKKVANVHGRLRRVEHERGTVADGREPIWALLLHAGTASRADALRWFWRVELEESERQNRAPDPGRPIMALKLIDAVYPGRAVALNLEVNHPTGLAYQFEGWSRAEIAVFVAATDSTAAQPKPSDEAAVLSVAEKIDSLMTKAEATWSSDEATMRLLVNGPDLGGGR
jgi:hypothetical protein